MRYAILLAVFVALAVAAVPARATLMLATDKPTGTPLSVVAGSTSSAMTVSVFDPTPFSVPPTDNLRGYQVKLNIVPQGGSMGTLTFATPTSGPATPPSNYVLAGVNFGIAATNMGNMLVFFDFNFPNSGGVDVPDSPGKNLLAITFSASNDALGFFDIVAVPDIGGSEWTDNATPLQQRRTFVNVPDGGGLVTIGRVEVSAIPEAGAFAALALVTAAVGAWQLFKRRLV